MRRTCSTLCTSSWSGHGILLFAVVHRNAKLMKSHADESAQWRRGAGTGATDTRNPAEQADDEVATPPLTVINVRSRNNRICPHRGRIKLGLVSK